MRSIIAGTRTISDYQIVRDRIIRCPWWREITEVVSGASEQDVEDYKDYKHRGNVDILGALWAEINGLPVTFFPVTHADWKIYGKPAGPRRNSKMAEYAAGLILIWDNKSRGSKDMKAKADAADLRFWEEIVDGQALDISGGRIYHV